MPIEAKARAFFGWRVVGAAFVLAFFGWGLGFYGPPVFLHAVRETRGWSVALISAAVTVHFLVGAMVVANLPALYRRFGLAPVTRGAAISLASGVVGWAVAQEPWQLFAATVLSGAGWVAMSAAAINAIVSPWFVRNRVGALGMAYNGASIGGLVFSPLWVGLIALWGFPAATGAVGAVTVLVVWVLAGLYFARSPDDLGQAADGDAPGMTTATVSAPWVAPLPGTSLRASWQFRTLAAGMALALFAQIGLVAHLFSLLVPALGASTAGLVMGIATGLAMGGRMVVGWLMPPGADRRIAACLNYAMQIAGSLALLSAAGRDVPLLLLGTVLFGAGIGNTTSMPPLIAQVEFTKEDVPRVVALIVAMSQAAYAFAPATFGVLRELSATAGAGPGEAPWVFLAAALAQGLAIVAMLVGRRSA
ncbi:MAG: MFS transporter [Hyphomicrobiaceae bacterium]|nr:MFS transporter [Hyphomicrobiaceae bacterium]